MSVTMNINLYLNDKEVLLKACKRLNYRIKNVEKGIQIKLNTMHPVIIRNDGCIEYDRDDSSLVMKQLNKLKAYYGLEKAKQEARSRGYLYYETEEKDKIKLKIKVLNYNGI